MGLAWVCSCSSLFSTQTFIKWRCTSLSLSLSSMWKQRSSLSILHKHYQKKHRTKKGLPTLSAHNIDLFISCQCTNTCCRMAGLMGQPAQAMTTILNSHPPLSLFFCHTHTFPIHLLTLSHLYKTIQASNHLSHAQHLSSANTLNVTKLAKHSMKYHGKFSNTNKRI